jgi:peptidyl-prolyl cis-trans isomerase A (cyclophilin A)
MKWLMLALGSAALIANAPAFAQSAPTAAHPSVLFKTTDGDIRVELYPEKAPKTVANFLDYVKSGQYSGTIFHRVIPGFMIQGGDPKGDGTGDPGYKFKNEVSDDLLFDKPGRLAYANAGPGTNGSQFFITEVATPHLNGGYTIFGQCDDATVGLVKQIAGMSRDPMNDKPFRPVKILHVKITYASTSASGTPATKAPAAESTSN